MDQASQGSIVTMASNHLQKILSMDEVDRLKQAMKKINPENIRKNSKPETAISPPLTESNVTFLVFVNPKSGGQDGPHLLDKFRELFKKVSGLFSQ